MFNNSPVSLGTIVDKHGGGSDVAQLTTSYTPGKQVSTDGMGAVSSRCTVGLGGSTATKFRVMDYTDPRHPRALLSTVPDDGLGAVIEHTVAPTPTAGQIAAGDFLLQVQLAGVTPVSAIEVKGTGVLTSSDTFMASSTAVNVP